MAKKIKRSSLAARMKMEGEAAVPRPARPDEKKAPEWLQRKLDAGMSVREAFGLALDAFHKKPR